MKLISDTLIQKVSRSSGREVSRSSFRKWSPKIMRADIFCRFGGTALAIVIGLLISACPPEKPAWSQIYADAANSGQTFAGRPAKQSSVVAQIGVVDSSSPVIGPDGSVYVGTSNLGSPPSGDLVRVSGSTLSVLAKKHLVGIISTPAVDQVFGNVLRCRNEDRWHGRASYLVLSGPGDNDLRSPDSNGEFGLFPEDPGTSVRREADL
jgi:outer membrane protein assembly factor BamB